MNNHFVHSVDRGRRANSQGLSSCTAMDVYSYCWSYFLVGFASPAAVVELHGQGWRHQFEQDTIIAVTGAICKVTLDNIEVACWQPIRVSKGSTLVVSPALKGRFSYIANQNGWPLKMRFGSVSSHAEHGIEMGWGGEAQPATHACRHIPTRSIWQPKDALVLRYIVQDSSLAAQLQNRTFTLTKQLSGSGFRLAPTIAPSTIDTPSQFVEAGQIQISHDGTPIVLMPKCQPTGGYPLAGLVHPLDIAKLSQLAVGGKLSFMPISASLMQMNWQKFCRFFNY